jgi:hypothetical protein
VKLRQLAPGVYADDDEDGSLHLDLPEMCTANGFEPTAENQAALQRAALSLLADPAGATIAVEVHHDGNGSWRQP